MASAKRPSSSASGAVRLADALRLGRHRDLRGPPVGGQRELPGLPRDLPLQQRVVARPERRLEEPELVRIELALHDRLAEAPGRVDQHHVGEPAVGIEREHDARAGPVRGDHLLDRDRQGHAQVIEAVLDAVDDGAIGEDRGEAAPARGEQRGLAPDPQIALVLAGEARLRQVLRGRARSDRHRRLGAVLARERPVGGDDLLREPGRQRGRFDERAQAGAGGGQRRHVLAGDVLQDAPRAGRAVRRRRAGPGRRPR